MIKLKPRTTFILIAIILLVAFAAFYNDIFYIKSQNIVYQITSAVGMSVSVGENEFNIIAQQLQDRENELSEKEKLTKEQETDILKQIDIAKDKQKKTAVIASSVIFLLLFLVLFNYYLDWKRRR